MPTEDVLLRTKLAIPLPLPTLVPRKRLIDRFMAGLQLKLVLVSAPAGFGKTTLLSEGVRASHVPAGWVSLEGHDDDPARFWSYVIAALQTVQQGLGESMLAQMRSANQPPAESMLSTLINEIMDISGDLALVLDDYHAISSPSVHSGIAFLLDHLPRQMHLVISTREDPSLPLARLRGRGSMLEIRSEDLRFKADETAALLNERMALGLADGSVEALLSRTEGWITALQMAALSLQGREDRAEFVSAFTGSHRYVLDYLMEEVLRRQPPDVQDFLLRTSILDRFAAPLCDAVAGRSDSRDVLFSLEHRNLFIVALDQSRQWYRYEHLFADLLRHQLGIALDADQVSLLHRQASQWYETNGFASDAVRHAVAASDWDRAATLIHRASDGLMKRGEVITLVNWIAALPQEALRAHPELLYSYSTALILTGKTAAAAVYLSNAEEAAGDDPRALGGIISLQAYAARVSGDYQRTIELSDRALSLLSRDDSETRCVVALNLGMAQWQSGRLTEAAKAFAEAESDARHCGNEYAAVTAASFLGVIQAARGNLRRAAETLGEAVRSTASPAGALARIYLGALLYELNRLDEAGDHLQSGIQLSRQNGNRELQMGGHRILAYVRQAQHHDTGALDSLKVADELAKDAGVSTLEHARNASSHVLVALAQGDLTAALDWSERMPEDADVSPFYPRLNLTMARVLTAQNRRTDALEHLQKCYQQAVAGDWQYARVETRVLQALAAPDTTSALVYLTEALQLGQAEGYLRVFLDKGESLAGLLREARSRRIATEYVAALLVAWKAESELHTRRVAASRLLQPQEMTESLSDRELEVLRLLSEGLSNREIARKLVVTIGTAKTHVHNIIGKLNASGRTQAIARARELRLI